MKIFTPTICLFLLIVSSTFAQQEKGIIGKNNWLSNWTEFRPNQVEHGEPTQILSGNITQDTKLVKRDTYLLLGSVFVTDSTTLTIEPGTVIIGDFKTNGALIITRGSKIIAEGMETDPIVFTSNRGVKKEGDWGGVFILGDAPINKFGNASSVNYGLRPSAFENISYGGDNTYSDSGVFKYVRIEYAGRRTRDYGYFNSLTLAGVGSNTVIENVMVSYSDGNSFNIIGGEVNLEKLVSFRTKSNDYEFNFGTQSTIRNSLAIRSPYVSGSDGSRAMYIASYDKKDEVDFSKKGTSVHAENLTLISVSENLEADIKVGLVKEALYISEDADLDIRKSVISGFNPAVIINDKVKVNAENLDRLKFSDMYFNNCNGNIFTENDSNNADLENWYGNSVFFNVYSKGNDTETFIDVNNNRRPDFRLRINKIIASNDRED
ncbi:hypothetical protein [Gelidibacter maritimus]|uniref:T9SS C-terminal target domain-containing protein n=1 Tax=Gelidibacter maritimus TaxID=2761487 RepID=A0A7W2M4D2_9FLAO|nr:hypothetical protein [Gelidibacter maritimus]MBA6152491.1 hypothetical protein [Gelidibacter maritimus]